MQTTLSDKYHIATESITDYGVTETVALWSVHTLTKSKTATRLIVVMQEYEPRVANNFCFILNVYVSPLICIFNQLVQLINV